MTPGMCSYCGRTYPDRLTKRSPCCGDAWYPVPVVTADPDTAQRRGANAQRWGRR